MAKHVLHQLQLPPGWHALPRAHREVYAAALMAAEKQLRDAQAQLRADDSRENRAHYARALANYDLLQGMFPFVAAGAADAQA
jgi:hypothetical protein